jgi:hypothetical protein
MISKNSRVYHQLFSHFQQKHYTLSDFEIDKFTGEYPDNYLMDPGLKKKTQKYNQVMKCTWVIHSDKTVQCSFFLYSRNKIELNEKQMKTLIDALSFILSFSLTDKQLVVHFVPLKDKKRISKHLSNRNVNSGSSSHNEIFVYRYEECLKVLFHECIHFLGFSDQSLFSEQLVDYYKDKYELNVQSININEAYTEIFARLFLCYYLSNQSYPQFLQLLKKEYRFSHYQANKILEMNHTIDVNQHTNTIAYYLVTCELFYHLHTFLNFCMKHNRDVFYLKQDSLFQKMIFPLKKITHKKILKSQPNYSTMRMTISHHPFFP